VPDPSQEDGERAVIDIGNYTRNVSPMWARALDGTTLGDVIESTPAVAQIAGRLQVAVARMEADPATYRAMNPENGWGDYDGALAYLRNLADACVVMAPHPGCVVRVSR
jgi:hypothetical protein